LIGEQVRHHFNDHAAAACKGGDMIRDYFRAGLLAMFMAIAWPAEADVLDAAPAQIPGEIRVMTLNQYLGADLAPVLGASSPASLNDAVLQLLRQAAANEFPVRAGRQADLIMARRPDLIGLQEVFHLGCRDLPPRPGACSEPSIRSAFQDQLSVTLTALRARGGDYEVAAKVINFDLREIIGMKLAGLGDLHGLPFTIDGKLGLLTAYDQDVILKRRTVATQPVHFVNCRRSAQGCNYTAAAKVPIPLPIGRTSIEVKRGYVGVDASLLGRTYRFVNTHLEIPDIQPHNPASAQLQALQATELLAALGATPQGEQHLIVVGDFNSSPTANPSAPIVSPYQRFVLAGFVDVWKAGFPTASGFTCCQEADLRNPVSRLFERIDLIFAKQPVLVEATRIDGRDLKDRTAPIRVERLWPSDHAAVVAQLRY
jgi:endonuclease/exonuclease/phosphatase family metal-dependent hydrolase